VFSFTCFLEIYSRASNFKTFSIHTRFSRDSVAETWSNVART